MPANGFDGSNVLQGVRLIPNGQTGEREGNKLGDHHQERKSDKERNQREDDDEM